MVYDPNMGKRKKFQMFPRKKRTITSTLGPWLAILGLFVMVRLVMVVVGPRFFSIPVIDPILEEIGAMIISKLQS